MRDLFDEPQRKTPFEDQLLAVQMLRDAVREGHTRIVLRLATGGGKTFIASMIFASALGRGKRGAFVVPQIELIDQTVEAFEMEGIERIGVIQADHPRKDSGAPLQVCSVQTLARRKWPEVDIVLIDECHVGSELVRRWMKERPETLFIGLSATPWRKGMASEYTKLVEPIPMHELMRRGRLCGHRFFALSHPDLGNVRVVKGDYDPDALADVMSDGQLLADIAQTYLQHGQGRPALCFAVDRAHAKKLQRELDLRGLRTAYIDAYTDKVERRIIRRQFQAGELDVVCNVGVLTTGVDWDVRAIIMARPTKSKMLWVQMIGRGLRTAPGKDHCLVLDHTDNVLRLGFPEDITEPFLLDGKAKIASERSAPLPKACPECGFVKPPRTAACPQCGHRTEAHSDIDPLTGELVEVARGAKPKKPTPEEKKMWHRQLYWIALDRLARKGKPADPAKWAMAKFRARFGEWPHAKHTVLPVPESPCREVLNWVKAQDIAFARSRNPSGDH